MLLTQLCRRACPACQCAPRLPPWGPWHWAQQRLGSTMQGHGGGGRSVGGRRCGDCVLQHFCRLRTLPVRVCATHLPKNTTPHTPNPLNRPSSPFFLHFPPFSFFSFLFFFFPFIFYFSFFPFFFFFLIFLFSFFFPFSLVPRQGSSTFFNMRRMGGCSPPFLLLFISHMVFTIWSRLWRRDVAPYSVTGAFFFLQFFYCCKIK